MPEFETLLYEEENQVAWVTLNRPEVYNAFNFKMAEELRDLWRGLRFNRDVNCVVLTIGSWAIFILGLKLVIPLWPTFITG